ncbi:hypothetical protein C0995_014573, partial [Termitomyces sp. Mi166
HGKYQAPTVLSRPESGMKPKRAYRCKEIPLAEMGCSETAKEFSAQMSKCFMLKGPQQQKEGEGDAQKKLTIQIPAHKQNGSQLQSTHAEIIDRARQADLEQE